MKLEHTLSAEEAVRVLLDSPRNADAIVNNYYDEDVLAAAERFHRSAEWLAVRQLIGRFIRRPGVAVDLGAGRGIAAYALCKDGWHVTAVEPDPSALVGAGAIRELVVRGGTDIRLREEAGEKLGIRSSSADLVFCRQVLHHARDLEQFCREVCRMLRPGGLFLACREPVVDNQEQLAEFLSRHQLHRFTGGENACTQDAYCSSIERAGLHVRRVLGRLESPINYFPITDSQWREQIARGLMPLLGYRLSRWVSSRCWTPRPILLLAGRQASRVDKTAGRLQTFVAVK